MSRLGVMALWEIQHIYVWGYLDSVPRFKELRLVSLDQPHIDLGDIVDVILNEYFWIP